MGPYKTEEKSNEITVIPELLKLLDLEGCVVTIDAMGCQKNITENIIDAKADYVLSLKDNHMRILSIVNGHSYYRERCKISFTAKSEV